MNLPFIVSINTKFVVDPLLPCYLYKQNKNNEVTLHLFDVFTTPVCHRATYM
jgi:hypothetical protein